MRHRHLLPLLCALTGLVAILAAAPPAKALTDALTRRTLHVSAGLNRIVLDAPEGACFLDETLRREAALIAVLRGETPLGEQFLGAMGDCLELAGATVGAPKSIPAVSISWNNPAVGDITHLTRANYLDMMETVFRKELGEKASISRTDSLLAVASTREEDFMAGGHKITSVHATTQIKGVPLVLRLTYTRETTAVTPEDALAFAEDFTTLAIALNEGNAQAP